MTVHAALAGCLLDNKPFGHGNRPTCTGVFMPDGAERARDMAMCGRAVYQRRSGAFQPYYSAALATGNWSDVTLALSGSRQPGAAHAPRSYALYASLGEDATTMVMGSAYFSVLTPGARLRPHCGPTNIRLRVHIGLDVPSSAAAMRVGNETRVWKEGSALVFDDSFEHEVWNESNEPRLVFIFDIWHPKLSTDEQRYHALDSSGKQRYQVATAYLRAGQGLPEGDDLVKDRRVRVVY